MKKILFLFASCLLLFSSCESDDGYKGEPLSGRGKVPVSIMTDKNGGYTYTYDNKNRITQVIINLYYPEDRNEIDIDTIRISYNDLDQPVECVKINSTYLDYPDLKKPSDSDTYTYSISYEGDQILIGDYDVIRVDKFGNILGGIDYFEGYFTYDDEGRLEIEGSNYDKSEYEYDDENGIFKNVNAPKWLLTYFHLIDEDYKINNPILITTNSKRTTNVKYNYDKQGYPTTQQFLGKEYYDWVYRITYK